MMVAEVDGIGSAMMDYAFALAKKMGYEQIELEVVDGNIRTKNLYERFEKSKPTSRHNHLHKNKGMSDCSNIPLNSQKH